MFNCDDKITTVGLLNLKNDESDLDHMNIEELVICAYMDGLALSDYLKAIIQNEYCV